MDLRYPANKELLDNMAKHLGFPNPFYSEVREVREGIIVRGNEHKGYTIYFDTRKWDVLLPAEELIVGTIYFPEFPFMGVLSKECVLDGLATSECVAIAVEKFLRSKDYLPFFRRLSFNAGVSKYCRSLNVAEALERMFVLENDLMHR